MATRRRDAGNSDLKTRLGISDAPEAPPVSEAPAAPSVGATDDPSIGAATSDVSDAPFGDVGASSEDFGGENYADVVEDLESPARTPPKEDWRDATDYSAPAAPIVKRSLVLIGVGAMVLAGVIGGFLGKVSEANSIYNAQTDQAGALVEPIAASATGLAALQGELEAKPTDRYDASVDELLASAFGAESKLVLSPAVLNSARMVLAEGEVGGSVTSLLATLQTLGSVVKRHLSLTQVDLPEIQREIAGAADETKFVIVFDVRTMQARYQAHTENPEPGAYQLVPGLRVPFPDDAEVKEVRQGQSVDYYYELRMPDGKEVMVPIYGLVSIDKSQLESGGRVETAQMRWVTRVNQIREMIAGAQMGATRANTAVEDLSGRGKRFAF